MSITQLSLSGGLALLSLGFQWSVTAKAEPGTAATQPAAAPMRHGKPEDKTPEQDGLTWLVGRWRCVSREYLTEQELLSAGVDQLCVLAYFNVYFPYADDRLTLSLTDNPEERPIAAELLVRHVYHLGEFREQLMPMYEGGPIRIGKRDLWYGSPLLDDFKFKYSLEKRGSWLWLTLESKAMRFQLIKLSSDVGDIRQSFVIAPIKGYSAERIQQLRRRYSALGEGLRDTSGSVSPNEGTNARPP